MEAQEPSSTLPAGESPPATFRAPASLRCVHIYELAALVTGLGYWFVGPVQFLSLLPFLASGGLVLGAAAAAMGTGSAGLLVGTYLLARGRVRDRATIPAALIWTAASGLLVALPGIGWLFVIARQTWILGAPLYLPELGAALGLVALPAILTALVLVTWAACRRVLASSQPGGAVTESGVLRRLAPLAVFVVAGMSLTGAALWPGRPPVSGPELYGGRTLDEWARDPKPYDGSWHRPDEHAAMGEPAARYFAAWLEAQCGFGRGPEAVATQLLDWGVALHAAAGIRYRFVPPLGAVEAIGDIGPAAALAVPALQAALRHLGDSGFTSIAHALGEIGGTAAPAIPELLARADTAWKRRSCLRAIGAIGPKALPYVSPAHLALLQAGLTSVELPDRVLCAYALARLNASEDALSASLPILVSGLTDPECSWDAAQALIRLGAAASPVLPSLLRREHQRKEHDTESPVPFRVLAAIGGASPECLVVFIRGLRDDFFLRRFEAAQVIVELGGQAATVAPALAEALEDTSPEVRSAAAVALLRCQQPIRSAIEILEADLEEPSPPRFWRLPVDKRRLIAESLGQCGASARPALPLLRRLREDPWECVRMSAAEAIAAIEAAG